MEHKLIIELQYYVSFLKSTRVASIWYDDLEQLAMS
jgi:hypothetical protein